MKKIFTFFLYLLCFSSIKAQVSQEEFDALVDLYNATDGDNWTDNSNWDINGTKDDVTSDWYGLTVNSGYIQMVNLSNNNLTGTIPESITDLYRLSALYLQDNNLTGSLPENIFVFSRYLQNLYLYNNQLIGTIPSRIYNVSQFRALNLGGNNLTGSIPKELGVLRYLTTIQLYNNNLTGEIPVELGNISTLTTLQLSGNQLTGEIPAELGNASNLSYLNLSDNQLTGSIPSELGTLSKLNMLYLYNNQLSGDIPSEFQALTALTYFRIQGNQITGMPNLTALPLVNPWIEDNRFTFADLETNKSKLSSIHISPQAKVGEEEYSYIELGTNRTLSVTVDGSHNTYQWYKNDVAISGATSSSYNISNFQLTYEGVYYCKISNTVVTVLTIESNYVGLSNSTTPIINAQPETISDICPNETATFTIDQSYGVSYQWQEKSPTGDWQDIDTETDWIGGTTNTISSVNADIQYLDGYSYRCEVTNPNGSARSIAAELQLDTIAPELEVQNFTLYLDNKGNSELIPSDVVINASDNCTLADTTLSQTSFDCLNTASPVNVNVTLSDVKGNQTTKQVTITVLDTISPFLFVKDATLYLDENGSATLSTSDIGNGSADNCQTAYTLLSQTDFDCSHLASPVGVYLSLYDVSGNSTTKQAYVTVLDTIKPNLTVEDVTLQLDEDGDASLLKTDVVTSATDNCSISDTTISQTDFDCSNIGVPVTVEVTLSDGSGNQVTKQVVVTIEDRIAPVLGVQDVTLQLDKNDEASLIAADVVTSASDNCSLADTTLSLAIFNCSYTGNPVTVNVTLTDASGNEVVGQVSVTVIEDVAPELSVQDFALQLDENGNATLLASDVVTSASDNCTLADTTLSQTTFDCADISTPVTVDVTLSDASGNEINKQITVTIEDNTDPVLSVQDITLQLDENGNATLLASDVVTSALDNCSVTDTSLSQTSFDCADLDAPVTVDVTFSDASGNEITEQVTVTIEDNIAPVLNVQNITLQLNENGEASISASEIVTAASDNCMLSDTLLSQITFDCSSTGSPVTVDVTITDISGNQVTEEVTITVFEDILPEISVQDVTLQLNENGNATLLASEVVVSASDNCTLADTTLSQTNFDCADLDAPVIVDVTLFDASGNEVTKQASITIEDNINPVISVQDFTLQFDESENATLLITDVMTNASDNCSLADTSLSQSTFSSVDIGEQTIDVILTDAAGNQVTEQVIVTVEATPTGIEETLAEHSIIIYPNPAKEFIQISRNGISIDVISIIDYSGRIVLHKLGEDSEKQIDISNLRTGIYIIKIKSNNKYMTYKLIKE